MSVIGYGKPSYGNLTSELWVAGCDETAMWRSGEVVQRVPNCETDESLCGKAGDANLKERGSDLGHSVFQILLSITMINKQDKK